MSNPFRKASSPLAREDGNGGDEAELSRALEESITIDARKREKKMEKEREKEAKRSLGKKSKKPGPSTIDVIDKLDLSTLYGGLGGFHHEGPYDAASTARNAPRARRPAPMAAFTPGSLVDPTDGKLNPLNHPRPGELAPEFRPNYTPAPAYDAPGAGPSGSTTAPPNGQIRSTRRQPSPLATNGSTFPPGPSPPSAGAAELSPPSAGASRATELSPALSHASSNTTSSATSSPSLLAPPAPSTLRRPSDTSSIHLGYPHPKPNEADHKRAAWNEAFGFVEQEAWQDFGHGKAAGAPGPSRESLFPIEGLPGEKDKAWRAQRVASVWDMEATLKAGMPVGSAPPPVPAMPPLPAMYANGGAGAGGEEEGGAGGGGGPKRSKSLIQRIRKVRTNPNVPMGEDDDDGYLPQPHSAVPATLPPPIGDTDAGEFDSARVPRRQKSAMEVRSTSRPRVNTVKGASRPVISAPIQAAEDNPDSLLAVYAASGRPAGAAVTPRAAPLSPMEGGATDSYFTGKAAGEEDEGAEVEVLSPGGTTSYRRQELGRKPSLMQKMKGVVVGGGSKKAR